LKNISNNYPEWNATGTEPDQSKKDEGWQPGEKPPADWFNWKDNKDYQSFQDIDAGIADRIADVLTEGVLTGGAVTENTTANLSILVEPLTGFNINGARINLDSQQTVDLSNYLPTTVGNEKYVSVYIDVMDLETNTEINIVEGISATAGSATKPAIDSAQGVLLADILLTEGQTTILNDNIEVARKQKIHLNNIAGQMDFVNVNDYGAVGDGITDDSKAIQYAIDSIPDGDDLYLYFPYGENGQYSIENKITIANKNNVVIEAQNSEIIANNFTGINQTAIKINNCNKVELRNVNFNYNNTSFSQVRAFTISFIEKTLKVINTDVYNFGNSNRQRGFYLSNINKDQNLSGFNHYPGALFIGCNFYNECLTSIGEFDYNNSEKHGEGVYFGENAEYWKVIGCSFFSLTCGIYIDGGANGTITNSEFELIDGRTDKTSGIPDRACVFSASGGGNNGKLIVSNCKFTHNYGYSIISYYSSGTRPLQIINNQFIANVLDPILIQETDRTMINSNYFDRCYNYNNIINYPYPTSPRQFIAVQDADMMMVNDNYFLDSNTYAINLEGTLTNIKISDNIFSVINTANINNVSSATNVVQNDNVDF
jgi:hypothetical protein